VSGYTVYIHVFFFFIIDANSVFHIEPCCWSEDMNVSQTL